MESNTKLLLEELTRMICDDIRKCFAEHVAQFARDTATSTSCIDESVLSPPFVPAPEVQATVDDERFTESVFHQPFVPASEIQVNDDVERFTLYESSPPQRSSPTPLDLGWSVQPSADLAIDAVASHTQDDVLTTSRVELCLQGSLGVDLRREEAPDAVGLGITVLCTKFNASDPWRHPEFAFVSIRESLPREVIGNALHGAKLNDAPATQQPVVLSPMSHDYVFGLGNGFYDHDDSHFGHGDFHDILVELDDLRRSISRTKHTDFPDASHLTCAHQMYGCSIQRLSDRLFRDPPWLSAEAVATYCDGDHVFLLLYRELSSRMHRHPAMVHIQELEKMQFTDAPARCLTNCLSGAIVCEALLTARCIGPAYTDIATVLGNACCDSKLYTRFFAAALMACLAPKAKVLRDGHWSEVESAILVPGDIISVELGDIIPANAHLLEGDPLKMDQSALTGDRVYSGSTGKQGEIQAVVIATSVHSFVGKAAHLVGHDMVDVLLAERRVDLALDAPDEAERMAADATQETLTTVDNMALNRTISENRQKLADQLTEAATRGDELRTVASALKRLGNGPLAHSFLLSTHDQKMAEFLELEAQEGIRMPWNVIPSTKQEAATCTIPVSAIYTPMKPYDVKHEYDGQWNDKKTRLTTCNSHAQHVITASDSPQVVEVGKDMIFTYDVDFKESDIKWASQWDSYVLMIDDQIHWFSTVNSLVIVLFPSGMVAMIMLRTLYRDISKYSQLETQEKAQEETWKHVQGDVFRPPANSDWIWVYVGTGVQFFGMLLATMVFVVLGFPSPSTWGGLLIAMLLLWVFMGLLAGYSSSCLYKLFKCKEWKNIALRTAFTFPGSVCAIFFFLNDLIWASYSSAGEAIRAAGCSCHLGRL